METWERTLEIIKEKVSESSFKKWLSNLKPIEISNSTAKIAVSNAFVKDWVKKYYEDIIISALSEATSSPVSVEFEVTGEEEFVVGDEKVEVAGRELEQPINRRQGLCLNPRYSFEKFVVGPSNQFAHAASLAVASAPGGCYNPLFIYGGVGLGKTHLLNAIGLKIREKMPELKVTLISAEQFMNELIYSLRFERMDQFRKKYREHCDVFLVDDVQFIAGKETTQDEFFHTFNILYETGRQIVVTSDRFPQDLHGMEERLRSRFEWGLITDIKPPDLETRIAILKKKADINGISLSDDVAFFIASQIKSNVRELEGALVRLSAFSSLHGVPITVDLAKEVLKNIIKEHVSECSVEAIQRAVAEVYHIKVSDLKSPRRLKSVALPRQIAMYLSKKHLNISYPEIGYKFGGKDHSTVIHAVKKISKMLEKDEALKRDIEAIERSLI